MKKYTENILLAIFFLLIAGILHFAGVFAPAILSSILSMVFGIRFYIIYTKKEGKKLW